MEVLLQPSFWATSGNMSYAQSEDINEGALTFLHGYETQIFDIEPGEELEIDDRFQCGNVESDFGLLRLQVVDEFGAIEIIKEDTSVTLNPGKYRLEEDGSTFTLLS